MWIHTCSFQLFEISDSIREQTYGDVLIEVDKKTMKCIIDIKQEANNFECRKINSTFKKKM